jgi:hypothetical protein
MTTGAPAIEHGTTRTGRWLRDRRFKIALWIAVLEGVVAAVAPGVSRWTIVAVAVLSIALYVAAGRTTRWDAGHQLSWILAASQALAVIVTILSWFIVWAALLLVAIFAVVALVILFTDR